MFYCVIIVILRCCCCLSASAFFFLPCCVTGKAKLFNNPFMRLCWDLRLLINMEWKCYFGEVKQIFFSTLGNTERKEPTAFSQQSATLANLKWRFTQICQTVLNRNWTNKVIMHLTNWAPKLSPKPPSAFPLRCSRNNVTALSRPCYRLFRRSPDGTKGDVIHN